MDAIVYTTNTGSTERYAMLLSERTGLPAYPLNKAHLKKGAEIIYLGWVMANKIQGYPKANKLYNVKATVGVGMSLTDTHISELRTANGVPASLPLFSLQGGFDMKRLRGIKKLMMTAMIKTVDKDLAQKKDRMPDEDNMLEVMIQGKNCVSEENLKTLLRWYGEQK